MLAYTVTCTFDDPQVAQEWIAWLREEHLREVIEAGALDAEVTRLDPPPPEACAPSQSVRCEVRYHFASREAFAVYERDHAPRLRAAGLKRFPPECGIAYQRRTAEVVARC